MIFIEPATAADAGPLARILGDWVRETQWMPVLHSREDDLGFVQRMIVGDRALVARDPHGTARGFIAVRQCDIAGFYVATAARRQGIGKALLDAAKAGERRLALWTFAANTGAIALYIREGFTEVERTDGACNEERLPDVRMIWRRQE